MPRRAPTNRPPGRKPEKTTPARCPSLKLPDVLDEIGMSRSAFYRMRARGKAPKCIKLPNGQIRIRRNDLDNWLERHEESDI